MNLNYSISNELASEELRKDCLMLLNEEKNREFVSYPEITKIDPYGFDSDEAKRLMKSEIFVARNTSNNNLLGFISILNKNYIDNLFVSKKYGRMGIGRTLIKKVLTKHPSQNFYLLTSKGNVPAITLYKSLGFTKTKEFKYRYQNFPIAVEQYNLVR